MFAGLEDTIVLDRNGEPLHANDYVTTSYKDPNTGSPVHHRVRAVFPRGHLALRCPVVLYEDGGYDPADLVSLDRRATFQASKGKPLQIRRSALIRISAVRVHNTCCGYEYDMYGSSAESLPIPLECPRCATPLEPLDFRDPSQERMGIAGSNEREERYHHA